MLLRCKVGRTYGRILDFSFGNQTENGYEMAFELVSGADFRCVLDHLSVLTRLGLGAKFGRKAAQDRNHNLEFSLLI